MKTYSYGKQHITDEDIQSVVEVLKSPYLTCGPKVSEFEQAICDYTGAKYCVAVNSATSGLHIAMLAAGAAKTKALVPVHFVGQSCDMERIAKIAKENNLIVIEDAAHAIGSEYKGSKVGACIYSDMTVFSFHPVKTITTAEGGAVTTNDEALYKKLLAYRSHGMHHTQDWKYDMIELGFNYRMTDVQAALGISQMKKLTQFKKRRREIVDYYNKNLGLPHLIEREFSNACFHLYPVLVEEREAFYHNVRKVGLNLQVHYIPVHTQPYYQTQGYKWGDYPNAEEYYNHCISLPLYPDLTDEDLEEIVKRIKEIL